MELKNHRINHLLTVYPYPQIAFNHCLLIQISSIFYPANHQIIQ